MHALDAIFWIFFAVVVAFIGWSFLRMLIEAVTDSRAEKRHKNGGGASGQCDSASYSYTAGAPGGSDGDTSSATTDTGSSDSSDSTSGDFSAGGGDYGGGGTSGGW